MKRIIAAIDGSEASRHALKHAAQLARAFDARLSLTHVIPSYDEERELVSGDEFEKAHVDYAHQLLAEAARDADLPPERLERLLLRGMPAEAMAEEAKGEDVWMVVVGSRGRGMVVRALLGSVSDRLVHICSRPVLVVR